MSECNHCGADISARVQSAYQAGRLEGRRELAKEFNELIEKVAEEKHPYWVTGDPPPLTEV